MISFFLLLGVLLALIVVGSIIREPEEAQEEGLVQAKETEIFSFSESPYVSFPGKVDKKNVVTIKATSSGIVRSVNVKEGQNVSKGAALVYIGDTYQGSSLSAVDEQIALKNKEVGDITYEKNEDVLDFQRDDVPKTDDEINGISRKQITIQKRNLELARDVRNLNLKKSQIANALHYPSSPTDGRIEKIHINKGDRVQVGEPLISFVSDYEAGTIEVLLSLNLAKMISVEKPSLLYINGQSVPVNPVYISKEATNNQQYSVLYEIPSDYLGDVANQGFVKLEVPLENGIEKSFSPMIPIDAVQLTQDKAYVFLFVNGAAESREVELGNVYGQFVQVLEGLSVSDEIILNRNVFEGDNVSKIEK